MIKISVIIPCYNTKKEFLFNCINSVIEQTFKDFEIILVDDGSEEEYRKIYKELEKLDFRIKIIYKENSGVSSSRNKGIEYAKGEYIIFVDSDDVLLPYFFEEAYETICEKEADIVYGCNMHLNYLKRNDKSNQIADKEVVTLEKKSIESFIPYMVGERLKFNDGKMYIGHGPWTRIIKSSLVKDTFFNPNLKYGEDVVWNIQILSKVSKVCYVKRVWYLYNINQESATKKFNNESIYQTEKGLIEIEKVLDLKNEMEYKAYCDRCFMDMFRICKNAIVAEKKINSECKNRLYNELPWRVVKEKQYWKLANVSNKLKILLYKLKIIFFIYEKKYLLKKSLEKMFV